MTPPLTLPIEKRCCFFHTRGSTQIHAGLTPRSSLFDRCEHNSWIKPHPGKGGFGFGSYMARAKSAGRKGGSNSGRKSRNYCCSSIRCNGAFLQCVLVFCKSQRHLLCVGSTAARAGVSNWKTPEDAATAPVFVALLCPSRRIGSDEGICTAKGRVRVPRLFNEGAFKLPSTSHFCKITQKMGRERDCSSGRSSQKKKINTECHKEVTYDDERKEMLKTSKSQRLISHNPPFSLSPDKAASKTTVSRSLCADRKSVV